MMNIRRRSVPEKLRETMSESIAKHAAALPQTVSARNVHLYLSIPGSSEVSTVPLVDRLDSMGKRMSVPVVRGDAIISALYRKGQPLVRAAFGQPEPESMAPVEESEIDIVLMPLLACDRNGYRIGYGKSFYDRFLGRLAREGIFPLRIGLAFSVQCVDKVPVDSWDEPLDGIVLETGIVMFR